jgi:hypothetical protein
MAGEYILETQDYAGVTVVLYRSVWEKHILVEHPDMVESLRRAEMTIRDPTFVYEDRTFPSIRLYYRLGAVPRFRQLYLTVVIRFDCRLARVLTMYATKRPGGSSGRLVYASARREH